MLGIDTMKIFISWSGNVSFEIAKTLKEWIPCVIQNAEPYFSANDIDKGTRWSTDIAKELENADFGILCVTKDNLNSSWLNFEAGSLSKAIDKARVCPFLYDLKPSDITDSPILQFQMTNFDREDMFKLFQSINNCLGESQLDEPRLEKMFDLSWDKIQSSLEKIETKSDESAKKKVNQSDMLEEMLELLRSQYLLLKTPERILPMEYLNSIINMPVSNKRVDRRISVLLDRWVKSRDQIYKRIDIAMLTPDINDYLSDFLKITEQLLDFCGYNIYPYKYSVRYVDSGNKSDDEK